MLDWLFSMEGVAAFMTCFATLMIFSFLYKDNPFYKFAEHVFVGTSAGYGIVLVGVQILKPNLIDRIFPSVDLVKQRMLVEGTLTPALYESAEVSFLERVIAGATTDGVGWLYYIFLILGIMMLMKITKNLHWISRWPLAYVIGAFAGIQIIQATQGSLIPQLNATMKDFSGGQSVEQALFVSGTPPDGELDHRRTGLKSYWQNWLEPVLPVGKADQLAGKLATELERDLRALLNGEGLEADPDAAFKQMRTEMYRVVSQDMLLERRLCQDLGGTPLVEHLWFAGQGESAQDPGIELPADALDPKVLEARLLESGLGRECLDHLQLEDWQEEILLPLQRIWLESKSGREAMTAALEGSLSMPSFVAAEALARPEGRVSLTELFKAEAFDNASAIDWSLPQTHRIVDSLLTQTNSRPGHLMEWRPAQLADLKVRLESQPALTVAEDLRERMSFFDHLEEGERLRAERSFMAFWMQGMLKEWRDTKQTWLLESCSSFAAADWYLPFTRAQKEQLRENPRSYLPADGQGLTINRFRRNVIIEILSNLLVVIGVCTGVFYFFFSKKHTGALGVVSKVGIAFLMMSFGASFGYTVMGRISLAIGRFQDLLNFPWMAGTALIVLVVALAIESRRKA